MAYSGVSKFPDIGYAVGVHYDVFADNKCGCGIKYIDGHWTSIIWAHSKNYTELIQFKLNIFGGESMHVRY